MLSFANMITTTTNTYVRSPLKWAGGKYRLLAQLHRHLPAGNRLVEPFLGSAVLFLNTHYKSYLLNDINIDLITFYRTVQQQGNEFIQYARKLFHPRYNTPEKFYILREKFNTSNITTEKAALFLYLNRHSYNGLCRYNNSGFFNTPFGSYAKPYFPEKELVYLHEKSQNAEFTCHPYEKIMRTAKKYDVVYCDPPYVPLTKTAHFTQYSGQHFHLDHQHTLAELAKELANRNIAVLISNHNTKLTRDIYQSAKLIKFKAQRSISCHGNGRNAVKELLAVY